jgi:alpha-1,3-glucan synthase
MQSQLTKTIKLALKSTEDERAILRARSAAQRFPVVEWRQRVEELHRRSISTSRTLAGDNSWKAADCDNFRRQNDLIDLPADDWNLKVHPDGPDDLTQDAIDRFSQPHSPYSTPILLQWSSDSLAPFDSRLNKVHGELNRSQTSFRTDSSGEPDTTPPTPLVSSADLRDTGNWNLLIPPSRLEIGSILSQANRLFSAARRHLADPFVDQESAVPSRPQPLHSRTSSSESISSIMEEKGPSSHLNKAIASVSYCLILTTIH